MFLRNAKQLDPKAQMLKLNPELVKEAPPDFINTLWQSKTKRDNLSLFLLGSITIQELLQKNNLADIRIQKKQTFFQTRKLKKQNVENYQQQVKILENQLTTTVGSSNQIKTLASDFKFMHFLALNQENIYKKAVIQKRFDKIRNLIEKKIISKDQPEQVKRMNELKNLKVFQHLHDSSRAYTQQLLQETSEGKIQKMKLLNSLNLIQHENPYISKQACNYVNNQVENSNPTNQKHLIQKLNLNVLDYLDKIHRISQGTTQTTNRKIILENKIQTGNLKTSQAIQAEIDLIKYLSNISEFELNSSNTIDNLNF